MSITDYCTEIKTMADLLANIDSPVPDKNLVTYTVNGLPRRWESVAMHIRLQKPLPSLIETRAILLGEEQRLNSSRHHENSHTDNSSSPTILQSGQSLSYRQNDRRPNSQPTKQQQRPPRYGWVCIPPPMNSQSQYGTPHAPAYNFPHWTPHSRPNLGQPNSEGSLGWT